MSNLRRETEAGAPGVQGESLGYRVRSLLNKQEITIRGKHLMLEHTCIKSVSAPPGDASAPRGAQFPCL